MIVQPYNEKWVVDSQTGHIKLFAEPNKCINTRQDGSLVLGKCSKPECSECSDKWGSAHLPVHEKVTTALKSPYGDLNLVTWMGLDFG